jgi:hypothetical protein
VLIRRILDNCRSKELLPILGVLIVSRRPLMLSEVVDITRLPRDIVSRTLRQVNPLVHRCSSSLDSQWCIRFDSLGSFLTTRRRAGDFFIDISAQHMRLTLRCLEALKDTERCAHYSSSLCHPSTLVQYPSYLFRTGKLDLPFVA